MTSAIQTLPVDKTFGLGFNYALWEANTIITLANVNWNSDYRDVVKFNSRAELNNYIDNNSMTPITINKASYAKFGKPVRLDVPFEVAQQYNYIRVTNPAQPIPNSSAKAYYYFISEIEYVAPNTTNIYIQLDVWQSFSWDVIFGNCFIEQGHIGIAATNTFTDHGREYLTIPEGMDIGNEYQIVDQWQRNIGSARGEADYSILVMSTVDLEADPGTVDNPKLNSAKGTNMENLPGGASLYVFRDPDQFRIFMAAFSDKPWITQGIISITAIPDFARFSLQVDYDVATVGGAEMWVINGGTLQDSTFYMKTFFRNVIFNALGLRYQNLKKFATYPYSLMELTTYSGTPIVMKPENWNSDHAEVVEIPHLVPPGARIMYVPKFYNKAANAPAEQTDSYGTWNDGGEYLDMATGIFNFPTFSLVNNGFMSFLASNKNSLAYQHSSADWSNTKTQQGIATSYDQASAGIGLSQDLNRQGMNAATQQANLANQGSMANGIIGGINAVGQLGNGPTGVISAATSMVNTGLSTALDINQRNQGLAISNGLAAGQNRSTTDNAAYLRDTNRDLASFAANGDYSNAIAGINAKVQDAKLTQPTTSGQIGGESFNLARYKWGVDLKLKMLSPSAMRSIGEYWLRYGYNINVYRTLPGDLQVMTHFTYWKLKETYIVQSKCPEPIKQAIRGIFEKGVTVWRDPNDIGNMDIGDNLPSFSEAL